jgi:phage terminase large subunit
VWFYQEARDSIRIIDYYEGQDQPIAHYVKTLRDKANKGNWVYGRHFGPHDIMQRDLSTGNTLYHTARELGLRWTLVQKTNDLMDGIEAVRQLLPTCRFNAKATEKGIIHLNGYRKQWDEKNKVYRNAPVHDKHSHAADAFRTLAMGLRAHRGGFKKKQEFTTAHNDYDPFK